MKNTTPECIMHKVLTRLIQSQIRNSNGVKCKYSHSPHTPDAEFMYSSAYSFIQLAYSL